VPQGARTESTTVCRSDFELFADYRSHLVDKEVSLCERREDLGRRVCRGPPKSMYDSTYINLRHRLAVRPKADPHITAAVADRIVTRG
jgi:hypothetical protein